ncbi:MAG: rod shape-determining protein [Deinococcaceae bacterium]
MNEDLAIDLGTCSTRIFGRNRGLCVDEPSVVASGKKTLDVAGHSAQSRVGHPSTEVVYPISNGLGRR